MPPVITNAGEYWMRRSMALLHTMTALRGVCMVCGLSPDDARAIARELPDALARELAEAAAVKACEWKPQPEGGAT